MTDDWNAAERVFHDKYLWMEVAKWDLGVYRALSKITRADQSDTLAYRRQLVTGMLKLYVHPFECPFPLVVGTACSNGGICYTAGTAVSSGRLAGQQGANPFGPVYYHLCPQTAEMLFSSGLRLYRTGYTWSAFYRHDVIVNFEKNDKIDEMLTVYRDNPFADFWPVPHIMKLRA